MIKLIDKSGIYSFTNKNNGKVYVGQSKKVLTRRKQHERGNLKNSRRFHNSIKKNGAESFDFQVLQYCSVELLDEREVYWITKLKSIYPNGYNLTTGGGAFQKHNDETKKILSRITKKRVSEGTHIFLSKEFIEKNKKYQIELGKLGKHPSQQTEFKAKRNETLKTKIAETGIFFKHKPETIELYRSAQLELYAQGKGKFQEEKLIKNNKKLVKQKISKGLHHTQQPDWSVRASLAATKQKKKIVLAIRTKDGDTIEKSFSSINSACRELNSRKKSISQLCSKSEGIITVDCNIGKIIKGIFGTLPNWDLNQLKLLPDSYFTRKIAIKFTIEKINGRKVFKTYAGIREGCRDLDSDKSAVRWILKGEKYKSTKCNIGRIIKVELLQP